MVILTKIVISASLLIEIKSNNNNLNQSNAM